VNSETSSEIDFQRQRTLIECLVARQINRTFFGPTDAAMMPAVSPTFAPRSITKSRPDFCAFKKMARAGSAQSYSTGKTFECDDASITKWNAIASAAGFAILFGGDPGPQFDLIPADNSTISLAAPMRSNL
jgi:hypothetical protein